MITFVDKIPDDCTLSPSMKEDAECFFQVRFFGFRFWVPVTKKMKRHFGISRRAGKYIIDAGSELLLEDMAQNIVAAVYYQVRETLADGVEESLKGHISEQFQRLFSTQLGKAVRDGMEQRALEHKQEG